MNQRASHFSLGSTSQNMGSIYTKDYPPKKTQMNDWKANNPFRGTSLGQGQQGSFATTNKTLLRAWDNVERAQLSEDKLAELKNHHFRLGSYAPEQSLTTNKAYHDRKQISGEASKNQQQSKNKMRTHNHDFKEQPFTNYCSAYANEYVAKEGGRPAQKVQGQQSGNAICFGSHILPHLTTSGAAFTPKQGGQGRVRPQPTMGIKLGDKPQPMQTMNQLYFNEKNGLPASLPESTMKELRATHFQLGQNPQKYVTQNCNYRNQPPSNDKLTYKIPVYESGTWVDKAAKFQSGTTNQRELPQRNVRAFERAVPTKSNGIALGGHGGSYTSEFQDNFGAMNPVQNKVQVNKKSSVVIGGGDRFYDTEHKDNYKTHNLRDARVDVDIKKLSKEDHFQIGGTSSHNQITVYKDEHRTDVENRNKLFHKENK